MKTFDYRNKLPPPFSSADICVTGPIYIYLSTNKDTLLFMVERMIFTFIFVEICDYKIICTSKHRFVSLEYSRAGGNICIIFPFVCLSVPLFLGNYCANLVEIWYRNFVMIMCCKLSIMVSG